jgi:hypothetical protein
VVHKFISPTFSTDTAGVRSRLGVLFGFPWLVRGVLSALFGDVLSEAIGGDVIPEVVVVEPVVAVG